MQSFVCLGFHRKKKKNQEQSLWIKFRWQIKNGKRLTPEEFKILREKGTERAFTGEYYNHKEEGTYTCAGCDNELFSSDTKYDSGSGWPAFFDAIDETKINTKRDISYGMIRTEITCAKCDSHLGHVFEDGPRPTGLRYCVNSLSLDFVPKKKT